MSDERQSTEDKEYPAHTLAERVLKMNGVSDSEHGRIVGLSLEARMHAMLSTNTRQDRAGKSMPYTAMHFDELSLAFEHLARLMGGEPMEETTDAD